MKLLIGILLLAGPALAVAQQQAAVSPAGTLQPPDALSKLAFMQGDWSGKQNFNTNGGPAMVGDATDHVEPGIANKYLCEMLSTTLPGRKPTDTRHFISYDAKNQKYTAWWFNDTSYHPTALTGDLTGNKLILMSDANAPGPQLRATYTSPAPDTLTYQVEMKNGDNWTSLFLTTYSKKAGSAQK